MSSEVLVLAERGEVTAPTSLTVMSNADLIVKSNADLTVTSNADLIVRSNTYPML